VIQSVNCLHMARSGHALLFSPTQSSTDTIEPVIKIVVIGAGVIGVTTSYSMSGPGVWENQRN